MARQAQQSSRHIADFAQQNIEQMKHVATLAAESNKHLYTVLEATQTAFASNTRQLQFQLQNTRTMFAAAAQWATFFQEITPKFWEMSGAWAELALQSMTETNKRLVRQVPVTPKAAPKISSRNVEKPERPERSEKRDVEKHDSERRVSAPVLFFPERRHAMLVEGAAKPAAHSGKNTHAT